MGHWKVIIEEAMEKRGEELERLYESQNTEVNTLSPEEMLVIRTFSCYFFFNGWGNINFGISLCLTAPNIEIHVPFGFFRVGWEVHHRTKAVNYDHVMRRCFGWDDGLLRMGRFGSL